jgi:hypothetical protein
MLSLWKHDRLAQPEGIRASPFVKLRVRLFDKVLMLNLSKDDRAGKPRQLRMLQTPPDELSVEVHRLDQNPHLDIGTANSEK